MKKEEVYETIEEIKARIAFNKEDMPDEDKQKFEEFYNWAVEKKYDILFLVSSRNEQLNGMAGNLSALRYTLSIAMLHNGDLLNVAASALAATQAIVDKLNNDDNGHEDKENLN